MNKVVTLVATYTCFSTMILQRLIRAQLMGFGAQNFCSGFFRTENLCNLHFTILIKFKSYLQIVSLL